MIPANTLITEDNILTAARLTAKGLPTTRLHTKSDWVNEAYLGLLPRMGKPFWSAVNYTKFDLFRRYVARKAYQPCERIDGDRDAGLPDRTPTSREYSPPDLAAVHDLDCLMARRAHQFGCLDTYRTLSDLYMSSRSKAKAIHPNYNTSYYHIARLRSLLMPCVTA